MAHEHAWDLEGDAKSMLNKLGITDYSAKVETLSGGQRKRVALAAVLLSTADLLILDEPTNHLDSAMADWLEEYLKKFRGALLMITHDRYFLDNVTNRIVELDKGKLYSYQSGYEGYLELKARARGDGGELGAETSEYPADGAGVDPARRTGTQHEAERAYSGASRR